MTRKSERGGGTKAKQKELHVTQNRLGMEARVWEIGNEETRKGMRVRAEL